MERIATAATTASEKTAMTVAACDGKGSVRI